MQANKIGETEKPQQGRSSFTPDCLEHVKDIFYVCKREVQREG